MRTRKIIYTLKLKLLVIHAYKINRLEKNTEVNQISRGKFWRTSTHPPTEEEDADLSTDFGIN